MDLTLFLVFPRPFYFSRPFLLFSPLRARKGRVGKGRGKKAVGRKKIAYFITLINFLGCGVNQIILGVFAYGFLYKSQTTLLGSSSVDDGDCASYGNGLYIVCFRGSAKSHGPLSSSPTTTEFIQARKNKAFLQIKN